jgi:hypothetical protein
MAQISFLQPPPVTAPLTDNAGNMTPLWQKWFLQAYLRIGGQTAISNVSLSATSGLLASSFAQSSPTSIYSGPAGVTTVIDSFVVTNTDTVAHDISVWLVPVNSSASTSNQFVTNLSILGGVTASISTLVSQVVGSGGNVVVQSNVSGVVRISLSGRQSS